VLATRRPERGNGGCGKEEATARHLGHSKLETTRIYAKWSDRQLRETIGRW
jgi:integrase/recombinase XerC